jgi:hypothetical protein
MENNIQQPGAEATKDFVSVRGKTFLRKEVKALPAL